LFASYRALLVYTSDAVPTVDPPPTRPSMKVRPKASLVDWLTAHGRP